MPKVAKHIFFSGRVQGVGFRFTAQAIARRYDCAGYVRNTLDGRVEVLAQGDSEDVDDFVHDLQETFSIRETDIKNVPIDAQYSGFNIAF